MKNKRKEMRAFWLFAFVLVSLTSVAYCKAIEPAKKIENAGEKIKSKFHETVDSVNKEKAHESIDKVADYLDKEKLKAEVDEIADYFDKEKIKNFIDYAAKHFNREKIKDMIDLVADSLDRDKVKDSVDQVIGAIDKEQVKDRFDSSVDQIAGSLQEVTHSLEEELKHAGNNKFTIHETVKKYNWNKWIADRASYGPATLSGLKLGGAKKAVVLAKPGEQIEGEVECAFNRQQCSPLSLYRVVLGIKNKGGQTTVFNHFGIRAGKETDHFTLTAPREKGIYQVGFRVVEAAREGTAIKSWDDENEREEPAVIGLIIVA